MSEQPLEEIVASIFSSEGLNVEKSVRVGRWEADIIARTTDNKTVFVAEVKQGNVGIPDILKVASTVHSVCSGAISYSGGLVIGTVQPSEAVIKVAEENKIKVILGTDPDQLSNQIRSIIKDSGMARR